MGLGKMGKHCVHSCYILGSSGIERRSLVSCGNYLHKMEKMLHCDHIDKNSLVFNDRRFSEADGAKFAR